METNTVLTIRQRVSFLAQCRRLRRNSVLRLNGGDGILLSAERTMPYSITLRSRTDATITGWYDGSRSRWSTDHTRQRLFDNKHEAKSIRDELRYLCPQNATVINV